MGWRWHYFTYRVARSIRLLLHDWRDGNDGGDWAGLASLMEFQLTEMIETQGRYRITTSWEYDVKRMKIAREMLRRMKDDDNFDRATFRFPEKGKAWSEMVIGLEKQEMDTLLLQLRHMQGWWH